MPPHIISASFSALILLAAGFIRGYSGFGSGMVAVLGLTLVFPPAKMVPVILLLEVIASSSLLPGVWELVDWSSLGWLSLGALFGTPAGAYILASITGRNQKREQAGELTLHSGNTDTLAFQAAVVGLVYVLTYLLVKYLGMALPHEAGKMLWGFFFFFGLGLALCAMAHEEDEARIPGGPRNSEENNRVVGGLSDRCAGGRGNSSHECVCSAHRGGMYGFSQRSPLVALEHRIYGPGLCLHHGRLPCRHQNSRPLETRKDLEKALKGHEDVLPRRYT